MSQSIKPHYTPEEYLALEEAAEYKSEYYQGEIYAMSGASDKHNRISINISTELNLKFRTRPCVVYGSDMKVHIKAKGMYTYPDISVVCGEVKFGTKKDGSPRDSVITNPVLIAEVLSPSTENYDRISKFRAYGTLESLQYYLLVDQERYLVDYYQRTSQGWLLKSYESLEDSLSLRLGGRLRLRLAAIYNKVVFD